LWFRGGSVRCSSLVGGFLVSQVASRDTTANRADHRMMTRVVAGYSAYRSTLYATLGIGAAGRTSQCQRAQRYSDDFRVHGFSFER